MGIIRLRGGGPTAELRAQIESILAEPLVQVPSRPPKLDTARTTMELEEALESDPGNAPLRLALGQHHASAGRQAEALAQFEHAHRLDPTHPGVLLAWAMALLQDGQQPQALLKLKQARDLDPENWRIRKQIWAIEHPEKFYREAAPDYGWQREQLKKER